MVTGPRVTIGVPVYNGERFLPRTLAHLQRQEFTDFRVIISDNGSTDGTEEICRATAAVDDRIRYHRSDVNRGVGWNFNRVLTLADTELFMWNAADDLIKPSYLSRCIGALDADPRAVSAYSRVQLIDENDAVVGELGDADLDLTADSPAERVGTFLRRQAVHIEYGVMRTAVLKRVGGEPEIRGGDVVLGVRLLMIGPAIQVPEQLFQARRHSAQGSMLTSVADQVREGRPSARIALGFPQTRIAIVTWSSIVDSDLPRDEKRRCLQALVTGWVVPRRRSYLSDVKQNVLEIGRWAAGRRRVAS